MKTKFKEGSEEYRMLWDYYQTIPFLHWMAQPKSKRGIAKDRPKDKEGRIIVDLTKPHVLTDMDYFRPAAIRFEKTGKYTDFFPSKNPSSPYRQFWDEEIRRCKEGYVRESDGEWIPGYYYFYLNYSVILKTKIIGERAEDGSVRAERVPGFPEVWDGDYLFFHYIEQAEQKGKHTVTLKRRGSGYSFKNASMLQRNFFHYRKSKSYAVAADSAYLDSDGILNKAEDIFSFVNKHAGFAKKLALKDTLYHRISGYKYPGDPTEYGFKSERIGLTLNNNVSRIRGKRGKIIIWEESGSFPDLIKAWRIAINSMEEGRRVFGLMSAFGTGGDKSSSFQGLETMFYNPRAFRILDLPNVYDKNVEGSRCGFFVPAYMNRADCYDKNGNSDVLKALEEIVEERVEVIRTSSSSEDVAQVKAEQPVIPRDAVMRTQGTVFPTKELSEHLAEIEPTIDDYLASNYIVDLLWDGYNKVIWKPNFEAKSIRTYPFREADTRGAVEIASLPKTGSNGEIPWGRYIIGVDPVDDDVLARGDLSLFAVIVFDLWTDSIVAWWIGRYQKVNDNFEVAIKLAIFYNAQINYENKLKGMYAYCDRKNLLRYLMKTPEILKDMEYVKAENLSGNKAFGTPATKQINNWARTEQADWMLSSNESYENKLNYKLIKSLRYLQEAYSWNIDGNFDFVSAMNMVMVARADRYKFIETTKNKEYDKDEWEDDPFFVQNYHGGQRVDIENITF